ncbi:GTP-binding protein [Nocardiopsis potens]|uniref:GTP-binding protein n=1 Tax=Nocardiopsis potens TaxID=1246458 RepID=UPI0003497360|nr:GTP-binding protein [Nocardiopsis potens]
MAPTLNIGIVAHVDAGKTSLTERLLFDTGAIDRLGRVDAGDTRTDTGRIERERGITVRAAVAPFTVGGTRVNLIDTPGHTDFVAEVERALAVLDGAVLVLSAVEGVQAHTRVLMRTLREAGLPALLFVNKTDRAGARPEGVLADVRRRLAPNALALGAVEEPGTPGARTVPFSLADPVFALRAAEVLAEHDDGLLAAVVDDLPLPPAAELAERLAAQTARGLVHPVLFGSAITGAGVDALISAVTGLLPAGGLGAEDPEDGGPRGTVFAVERAPSGEKTGYLRLFSGRLEPRARVAFDRADPGSPPHEGRITRLEVVGAETDRGRALTGGEIGRIGGPPGLRVGDRLGPPPPGARAARFARPSLESVARPVHAADAPRMHAALSALAEQDPLIRVRTVPGEGAAVLLYGEVQKEVIAATLAEDFGVKAVFEPGRTVHTEYVAGVGEAVETMDSQPQDGFWASIGLRVAPAAGEGVRFTREVELGALPAAFDRAIEETVHLALEQGLYGWPVAGCEVVLVRSGFSSVFSTAADFRALTPLVLMRALHRAGTRVHEPVHAFEADVPADALGPVTAALSRSGARVRESAPAGEKGGEWHLTGDLPARAAHPLQQSFPGLTGGEGVLVTRPVGGDPPRRPRTDGNPLDRAEYMIWLNNAGSRKG